MDVLIGDVAYSGLDEVWQAWTNGQTPAEFWEISLEAGAHTTEGAVTRYLDQLCQTQPDLIRDAAMPSVARSHGTLALDDAKQWVIDDLRDALTAYLDEYVHNEKVKTVSFDEVRAHPEAYPRLYDHYANTDNALFFGAIDTLVDNDISLDDAFACVWNNGHWQTAALAVHSAFIPTHVLITDDGREYLADVDGVLYTVEEWFGGLLADFELQDGELLFQGEPAALVIGAWELQEL